MTNIKHIEHPEDTILTGDLDVLGWFQSPGRYQLRSTGPLQSFAVVTLLRVCSS